MTDQAPDYTVTLDANQWNVVLELLAQAPWKVSHSIIATVHEQIRPPDDDEAQVVRDNGEAVKADR